MTGPVVLFDGVCHLCSGTVRFLLRHDARGRLRFAPLQSDYGQRALKEAGLDPERLHAAVADPTLKDALRRATEEAHAHGVTGVPTVVVGDRLYWGDDRLDAAAWSLSGSAGGDGWS